MAAAEPDRAALHYPIGRGRYTSLTFAQLDDLSNRLAHAFDRIGIQRGVRTAVMVPPMPDFFALTFALFKVAAVPVLIDPGMGARNLGRCLAEAEPQAFIGIPKAHLARRLLGWGKRTIRTTVNIGRRRFFCDYSLEQLKQPRDTFQPYRNPDVAADEAAAILFTSGSTGVAKGAVYTHGIFTAQVEMLKATYGIEPGEIDLCTFPLFALFGPALGMTCVIPDMDPTRPAKIDPRKAVAQIEQFGVTNLFGSPAVIRRLGELTVSRDSKRSEEERAALPTLRRVISAGAPARASDIERFVKLLSDGVQVYTPYGATEALPVANIGSREILNETRHLTGQGKGVCIGRPVAGMQVYVIPISDEPVPEWDDSLILPPGEIGEFVVRGPVVTREYFNRPEATRLAKIRDPRTGDILHRMGDVGYFDDQGRMWFCGRKSHRVVTPWGTLFTDMVEPVFNTVEDVNRTALVGVKRAKITYPVLCVELEHPYRTGLIPRFDLDAKYHFPMNARGRYCMIAQWLQVTGAQHDHTKSIVTFLSYPGKFPVDVRHNSKIFREKLAVWADKVLGKHWNPGDNTPVRHAGTGAAS
jgi:acyl-CoA synthetase (AMP-forming)/AMP-acid ligase II